jgi:hypothetical protein
MLNPKFLGLAGSGLVGLSFWAVVYLITGWRGVVIGAVCVGWTALYVCLVVLGERR